MRKYIIFVVALFFVASVSAQTPTTIPLDQGTWEAIKQYCIKNVTPVGASNAHTVKLEGTIPLANTPYELWRFTDGDNAWKCALDKNNSPNCNGISLEQSSADFKALSAAKSDLVSGAAGNVQIDEVYSYTPEKMTHYFFALAPFTAETTEAGDTSSLKLAKFDVVVGDLTKCGKVSWDPEGTAFDATTLEPISGTSVTLLTDQKTVYPISPEVRQNPYMTKENGHYMFYTPDGTYFLSVAKTGFRALTETEKTTLQQKLNTLQQKTGKQLYYNLYTSSNEPIVQKGKLEHRDIPLMPISPEMSQIVKPKITGITIMKNGLSQYLSGSASIPYATIAVYQGIEPIAETEADQFGAFELTIKNTEIDSTRPLEVVAIKPSSIFTATTAQSIENSRSAPVQIYPIPVYVEGYVYNNRTPVPNAVVSITIPDQNRTLITVRADKKGYIYIPAIYIPTTPFVISIANEKKEPLAQITTATFIDQNKSFMQSEKINILGASNTSTDRTPSTIIPITTGKTGSQSLFPSTAPRVTGSQQASQTDQQSESMWNQFGALIVTIVLASLFGGALLFIAKRKAKQA